MAGPESTRAHRVPVPAREPVIGSERYDYADAFEVRTAEPDPRSAEEFARSAFGRAAWPIQSTIRVVHHHVARFRLGPPSSPDHVFGWKIVRSEPDLVQLEAESPLLRAVLVGRRVDATRMMITTYLFYARQMPARVLWQIIGPLHRRIAPYLMEEAAATVGRAERLVAIRA